MNSISHQSVGMYNGSCILYVGVARTHHGTGRCQCVFGWWLNTNRDSSIFEFLFISHTIFFYNFYLSEVVNFLPMHVAYRTHQSLQCPWLSVTVAPEEGVNNILVIMNKTHWLTSRCIDEVSTGTYATSWWIYTNFWQLILLRAVQIEIEGTTQRFWKPKSLHYATAKYFVKKCVLHKKHGRNRK